MQASLDNCESTLDGVRAGSSDVALVLARSGTLLFRFKEAGSELLLDGSSFGLGWRRSGEIGYETLHFGWPLAPDPEGWYEQRLPAGRIDLVAQPQHGSAAYRLTRVEGVLIRSQEPTRVELSMARGAVAELRLAPGEQPFPKDHLLLLLEREAWDGVTYSKEGNSWGGGILGDSVFQRLVQFDEQRAALVRGLAPGPFRFKVFPDDLTIEPPEIELAEERNEPVLVRWKTR